MAIAGFTGVLKAGTAFGISIGVGVGAGLVSYSLENGLRSDREWTAGGFALAGVSGGFKAALTFGIGYFGGKAGAFDKMLLQPMLDGVVILSKRITYGIAKSMLAEVLQGKARMLMTMASWYLSETLAKMLFVSSVASGARWLFDRLFDWIFGN